MYTLFCQLSQVANTRLWKKSPLVFPKEGLGGFGGGAGWQSEAVRSFIHFWGDRRPSQVVRFCIVFETQKTHQHPLLHFRTWKRREKAEKRKENWQRQVFLKKIYNMSKLCCIAKLSFSFIGPPGHGPESDWK